ncbi:MAG: hypothetical protein SF182_14555 [Deltaproteobacteria bacterium]|nr:hypothetical protein [Deltaproteobacteria bacterium]
MADDESKGYGTMIISALLILCLIFAGLWILRAVGPQHDPQVLFPWFGAAAVTIVVVGIGAYVTGRWR